MTKPKAIEILQTFNRWRRGAEIPHPPPGQIGEAIDTLESDSVNAERYGVDRKTVWKWRKIIAARKAEE